MASICDACGYRNSELKPGGRIPENPPHLILLPPTISFAASKKWPHMPRGGNRLAGKRIILTVKNSDDLSRDVIKSDTAAVKVPELDLELTSGTLGGIVTTVEGLITKINESLERVHGFTFGDSLDEHKRIRWLDFKTRLSKVKHSLTLVQFITEGNLLSKHGIY